MAVNLIDNEEIHVNQDGSDITLEIQADALKNEDVVVGSIRSKNLINSSNVLSSSNGLNNTYNSNQSITYSGTLTRTFAYLTNKTNINLPAGDYSFSINKTLNYTVIIRLYYDSTNYIDITIMSNTTSRTLNVPNDIVAYEIYLGALTSGQSISDTLFFQLEKSSEATTFSPYQNLTGEEHYSTGEQVIGTWINGKPLYRKTLYFASNGGGTSEVSYTLSNYGITNVDTIFITHPSFYSNNMNGYRNPFQYYDGNKFSCGVSATTLNVTLGYAPISNSPFVITLEYTKTTD